MAELERGPSALGQQRRKIPEHIEVLLERGRQLKQQDAELRPERARGTTERLDQILAVPQLRVVRDAARRLQGEREGLGRAVAPAGQQLLVRNAIEGVVDLDRRKARRVEG